MARFVTRFLKDESGATAIEYGLLCALIGIVVLVAVTGASQALKGTFEAIANAQPQTAPAP